MTHLSRFALLSALVACACTTASVTSLRNANPLPGPHTAELTLSPAGQPVPEGFTEAGFIQAKVQNKDEERALELLRSEAARLGCDTLIGVRTDVGDFHAAAFGICGTTR